MQTAVDIARDVEDSFSKLVYHATKLEMDNASLKRVIRIMANARALDEEGNLVEEYHKEDVEFLKQIIDEQNVLF